MRALPLLLASLLLTSCSVLGLDEFDSCTDLGETQAERDQACANALNSEIGAPPNCRPFRCDPNGDCVEVSEERCDGADNDCDGDVDEEVFAPTELARVPGENNLFEVAVAAEDDGASVYWTESTSPSGGGGSGGTAVLAPAPATTKTPLAYFRHPDEGIGVPDAAPLEEGCWRRVDPNSGSGLTSFDTSKVPCNFSAIEADRINANTVIASLDAQGCTDGRLRVGHIATDGQLAVTGPTSRSNSYLGLGLTYEGDCSAANAEACQMGLDTRMPDAGMDICSTSAECSGGECLCGRCVRTENVAAAVHCGFTDMALATVPGVGSTVQARGLVAAVEGSRELARCVLPDLAATTENDSERSVALFGLWLQQRQGFTHVNATSEGTPLVLDQKTSGVGAPGVAGIGDGFLVGYPTSEEALFLTFVPALDAAPEGDITSCETAAGGTLSCDPQVPACGTTPCGSDTGICVSGTPRCLMGEAYCEGARNPDALEECGNGEDEDCDGRVDEADCVEDRAPMAMPEVCNGSDDDFDGNVDEDATGFFEFDTPAIYTALGLPEGVELTVGDSCGPCAGATVTCEGGRLLCNGPMPQLDGSRNRIDICGDGVDNDCNGTIDDPVGADMCIACTPSGGGNESCNRIDDDCDGTVDEDAPPVAIEVMPQPVSRDPATIRQCLATPELGAMDLDRIAGIGTADDVVFAVGEATESTVEVGVVYREILDGGSRIRFRILTLNATCACRGGAGTCADPSCDRVLTPNSVRSPGEAETLTMGAGQYSSPTIAYAPTGFRAGEGERTGGWYVLWTTRSEMTSDVQLVGVRVSEETGMPVDPEPFAVSASASSARSPQAYSDDTGVGYAYADTTARQLVSGRLSCAE